MMQERKADAVARDLLGRIVTGEIPVGSVLPREADLAESYGVNRGVVREANKLLEVHRLVRPVRRRGTEVLDPLESATPAVIRAMLVESDGALDLDVLAELLEVRAGLEAQMCGLAAERRTDADLEALYATVDTLDATAGDLDAYYDAVDAMALAMARATGNRIFVMLVHWHRRIAADLRPLLAAVRNATDAHRAGVRILVDAVRDRDATTATRLIESFHAWATPRILGAARAATARTTSGDS
jgi:DNA-binding FadR family transcriptional regulator